MFLIKKDLDEKRPVCCCITHITPDCVSVCIPYFINPDHGNPDWNSGLPIQTKAIPTPTPIQCVGNSQGLCEIPVDGCWFGELACRDAWNIQSDHFTQTWFQIGMQIVGESACSSSTLPMKFFVIHWTNTILLEVSSCKTCFHFWNLWVNSDA